MNRKRFLSIILAAILLFAAATCAIAENAATSRKLVVYYSYSQNTAAVARWVAALTGADLYEIRTVNAYPDDPYETSDISIQERREGQLPELVDDLPDLTAYDVVFIGGPIWDGLVIPDYH